MTDTDSAQSDIFGELIIQLMDEVCSLICASFGTGLTPEIEQLTRVALRYVATGDRGDHPAYDPVGGFIYRSARVKAALRSIVICLRNKVFFTTSDPDITRRLDYLAELAEV